MILINPKGLIGIEQKKLILIAFFSMLIIIVPVIFMAIIFSRKYRSSNTETFLKKNKEITNSKKIEFFSWGIPIIIISILSIITLKTTYELNPYKKILHKKKPIVIQVISSDWKWIFLYPKEKVATINKIVIPKNIPIEFKITGESVMNSFFIPALGSQIYAMPGMQTKLNLIANEIGKYKGFSSSYSGKGFSNMKFIVKVVQEKKDFKKWINKVKKSNLKLDTEESFIKIMKPEINVPVTYFSNIKKNLYEDLIHKFGNKHCSK